MPTLASASCIDDLREIARRNLPRVVFDFVDGGAGDEFVLRENRASLRDVALVPHALRDVSKVDTSVDLFGKRYALPFGVAPTGMSGLVWPEAERLVAETAREMGLPFILSTVASCPMEEIGAICGDLGWFQLYASRNRATDLDLIARAKASGFGALVITIDLAFAGIRRRDIRNGLALPLRPNARMCMDVLRHPGWLLRYWSGGGIRLPNLEPYYGGGVSMMAQLDAQTDPAFDWGSLGEIRRLWDGPLVVKGVLGAQDAKRAKELGVDGIIVSNHGGRQLDCCAASVDALPEIVDAVGDALTVMMDGGIRSGEDVSRALAVGARAVFAGRPGLYGAAAGGKGGIGCAFKLLATELATTMALLGCRDLTELASVEVRRNRNLPVLARM
ncbi:alpha-hydroxy acid oxidase [Paraburkholderia pallida]|uniref:Alpha-hydroxy-acid oxidizing protein n=1 Tax=Paraburkholderia pallida TaxID=2547399 RepID=A0A4P7CXL2_9BURK|nr:alpha-hydroxy acid oxidase [Paraburkholderia pallida]QBQ98851.1 alpha-hydroxy-acid oxidizing protein [Paraburkholderia pallida]